MSWNPRPGPQATHEEKQAWLRRQMDGPELTAERAQLEQWIREDQARIIEEVNRPETCPSCGQNVRFIEAHPEIQDFVMLCPNCGWTYNVPPQAALAVAH